MSSPLAKQDKSAFDKALVSAHQSLSHSRRIAILGQLLTDVVKGLPEHQACADIGCGDLTLSNRIADSLPGSDWTGLDIHPPPDAPLRGKSWEHYRQFDGVNLPFADQALDVGLFCDVLHHVPPEIRCDLLTDALRSCRHVVVKDHFEYGTYSRTMLRLMDFVGNYGYGISVPDSYFSREGFSKFVADAGGQVVKIVVGVDLYGHLPVVRTMLRPSWHFVATLMRA